jgi:hypothetical protein
MSASRLGNTAAERGRRKFTRTTAAATTASILKSAIEKTIRGALNAFARYSVAHSLLRSIDFERTTHRPASRCCSTSAVVGVVSRNPSSRIFD